MSVEDNFLNLYLSGKVNEAAIDDYINEWHESPDEVACELHEFLGMTWGQYTRWVDSGPQYLAALKVGLEILGYDCSLKGDGLC